MEELTNLINQANNAIFDFEKYIFDKHHTKYIVIKGYTAHIQSQINSIEGFTKIGELDAETKNTSISKLNSIINNIKDYKELFDSGEDISIMIDDNGDLITSKTSELVNNVTLFPEQEVAASINSVPDINIDQNEIETPANDFSQYLDVQAVDELLNVNATN